MSKRTASSAEAGESMDQAAQDELARTIEAQIRVRSWLLRVFFFMVVGCPNLLFCSCCCSACRQEQKFVSHPVLIAAISIS